MGHVTSRSKSYIFLKTLLSTVYLGSKSGRSLSSSGVQTQSTSERGHARMICRLSKPVSSLAKQTSGSAGSSSEACKPSAEDSFSSSPSNEPISCCSASF